MLASGSSRLFTEWQAYWRLEPWGEWRAELRSAHAIVQGLNVWRKKGASPLDIMRFVLPPYGSDKPYAERSAQWIKSRIHGFATQMNAANAQRRQRANAGAKQEQ